MTSFVSVMVLMSMLVAVAMSSDCSTGCSASCSLANTQCEGAMVLGPLCAVNQGACNQACAVVCGCVDKCLTDCQAPFAACMGNANGNPAVLVFCTGQRDVCFANCDVNCAIQNTLSTVQAVLGGGASQA